MIERILGLGILIGFIIRDGFGFGRFHEVIMICGSLLGFIYLFANWWLCKPDETSARTIIVSILYGLTSWSLTFAIIFKLLYLSGSDEMSVIGFILLSLAIGVDFLTSLSKSKVLNTSAKWRFGILTGVVIILFFIPEGYRISITYRNFPGFLKYYEANKDNEYFYIIEKNYFDNINEEEPDNVTAQEV